MGSGKTGYCSICKHPKVAAVNEVIKAGGSFTAALEEASTYDWKFAKGTFFTHKAHVTSPLLTAADEARKNPVIVPHNNKAVLEAIRDAGFKKIMENPDSITPSQTLRAASILAEKEGKADTIHVVLAKLLQGAPATEFIEGEYTVERLETTEA